MLSVLEAGPSVPVSDCLILGVGNNLLGDGRIGSSAGWFFILGVNWGRAEFSVWPLPTWLVGVELAVEDSFLQGLRVHRVPQDVCLK